MRLSAIGSVCLKSVQNLSRNVRKSEVDRVLLLGRVIQTSHIGFERLPCVKVRCKLNEFDEYLKMYFTYSEDFWATDIKTQTGLGDDVLIRNVKSASRAASAVTHCVEKVIFKYGNVIDPVTKKRIVQEKFSDEFELEKKMVKDIVEDPFKEESLLFEERRALQREQITLRKASIDSMEMKE